MLLRRTCSICYVLIVTTRQASILTKLFAFIKSYLHNEGITTILNLLKASLERSLLSWINQLIDFSDQVLLCIESFLSLSMHVQSDKVTARSCVFFFIHTHPSLPMFIRGFNFNCYRKTSTYCLKSNFYFRVMFSKKIM